MFKQNPGIVLVGEAGCGKTTLWKNCIQQINTTQHNTTQHNIENNESVVCVVSTDVLCFDELFGYEEENGDFKYGAISGGLKNMVHKAKMVRFLCCVVLCCVLKVEVLFLLLLCLVYLYCTIFHSFLCHMTQHNKTQQNTTQHNTKTTQQNTNTTQHNTNTKPNTTQTPT